MTVPIVLVPGMLCDADLWADIDSVFEGSVVRAAITAPTITGMARQVLDAVEGPFVLVGLSLGAIVGFEVARQAPQRLSGLCVMSTNAAAPTPQQYQTWTRQRMHVERGEFDRVVTEEIGPTMFAEGHDPRLPERFYAMATRLGPQTLLHQLAAQATRVEAGSALSSLSCPALGLGGESDRLCPPSFHRDIAERLPNVELELVPAAGHLLPWEAPIVVSAALSRFIETVRNRQADGASYA